MPRPLLSLAFLAACSSAPKATPTTPASAAAAPPAHATVGGVSSASAGIAAAFTCDDATTVYALFRNDSAGKAEVALAIGDARVHLPQLTSASGARYGDAKTTFWNRGNEVEFTRSGKKTTCHAPK